MTHVQDWAPPRDELFRAFRPGVELRSEGEQDPPTMTGHFAVFNEWSEIDSLFEGHFLERIAPGAFKKTFKEQRDGMRVLFQHGMDFQIGDKPLGQIAELREDEEGAYYEVPLLDAPYVREEILPGLRAGLYGASFRFRVTREEFNKKPGASEHNPDGLPERTLKELDVREFGPVTFPAYASATAGVRSITDDVLINHFLRQDPERMRALMQKARDDADPVTDQQQNGQHGKSEIPTDDAGARPTSTTGATPLFPNREDKEPSWRL
jgi:HK97 family phage prohead protease